MPIKERKRGIIGNCDPLPWRAYGNTAMIRNIERCTARVSRSQQAVEQPHCRFNDQKIRTFSRTCQHAFEKIRRHHPAIKVQTGTPGYNLMKRWINIIRACLGGLNFDISGSQS